MSDEIFEKNMEEIFDVEVEASDVPEGTRFLQKS